MLLESAWVIHPADTLENMTMVFCCLDMGAQTIESAPGSVEQSLSAFQECIIGNLLDMWLLGCFLSMIMMYRTKDYGFQIAFIFFWAVNRRCVRLPLPMACPSPSQNKISWQLKYPNKAFPLKLLLEHPNKRLHGHFNYKSDIWMLVLSGAMPPWPVEEGTDESYSEPDTEYGQTGDTTGESCSESDVDCGNIKIEPGPSNCDNTTQVKNIARFVIQREVRLCLCSMILWLKLLMLFNYVISIM